MPTKTFYLDGARTEPLTAQWGLFFRNFTVSYAGTTVAPTNPEATLAQGRQCHLPDGRVFSAQHKQSTYPQELELLIDGRPVPGSGTHPIRRIKQAWYALLVLGILNIGLGLVTEFGPHRCGCASSCGRFAPSRVPARHRVASRAANATCHWWCSKRPAAPASSTPARPPAPLDSLGLWPTICVKHINLFNNPQHTCAPWHA